MKITIEDLSDVPAKTNTLLHSPQYAAQLAGSSLFFQVMTGLCENPVKVILHDKFSGKRMLLTIETATALTKKPELKPEIKQVQPLVKVVEAVDAPKIAPMKAPSLSPKLSPPKMSPSMTAIVQQKYSKEGESVDATIARVVEAVNKPLVSFKVPPLKPK